MTEVNGNSEILIDCLFDDYDEQGQVIGAHELPKKKKGSYRIAGAADPDATYRVHGERIDFGYNISVAATDLITIPTITPNSGDVTHHPFKAEIAHFIQCLDENVESHASIYDSYRSMAVCFAIGESAALGGQPVVVFDK